jgi:hypothetical protein
VAQRKTAKTMVPIPDPNGARITHGFGLHELAATILKLDIYLFMLCFSSIDPLFASRRGIVSRSRASGGA